MIIGPASTVMLVLVLVLVLGLEGQVLVNITGSQAQDRESLPVKDQRSTTVLRLCTLASDECRSPLQFDTSWFDAF